MYTILFTIQVLAVLVCLLSIILLVFQKNTQQSKMMLLTIVCAFIQNLGYMLEMSSTELPEVMTAIKIEYVGTAYIAYFLTVFMFRYSNIDFPKALSWVWFAISTIVLVSVLAYQVTPLYYTSAEFVTDGLFPHVHLGKGPLYIVNALTIYAGLFSSLVVSTRSYLRTKDKRMRGNYRLLVAASFIPILGHMSSMLGIGGNGYDMAPLGVAVSVAVFSYAIMRRRIFDVVEIAHENILSNMSDAAVIVDGAYCFMECNEKAVELFPSLKGCSAGSKIEDVVLLHALRIGNGQQLELENRFYNVHVNEVTNNGALGGYVAIFFDITDSIHQLEQMRELKEQADEANNAKSLFLANMSHEIRTPINAIMGMNEVILRDYHDPDLKSYSMGIQNASKTLLSLVNDILDFSKIEAGKMEIRPEDYLVKPFLSNLVDMFEPKAKEKGLRFETDFSKELPESLHGDEMRIRQIAVNLVSNAIKYTREGYIRLSVSCEKKNAGEASLVIRVEDSGIGIRDEDINRMFERFERLDEKKNRTLEGAGLGLNIVKRLVDMMEGSLQVTSSYGQGSAFTAVIPQQIVQDVKKEQQEEVRKFTAPNAKILLVDDSKTNLIVEKALLKKTQVQVAMALSGKECLEQIEKEHFDLVFLDHRMPEMDGVETLQHMKAMHSRCDKTPVVMLTANAVNDARRDYLALGFDDFLSKPVNGQAMENMVWKLLPRELVVEVES